MPDFEPKEKQGEAVVRDADFGKDFDIVAVLGEEEAERAEKYARDMALKRVESGEATAGGVAVGGSEDEIAERKRQEGKRRGAGEEGGLGRLSEKEWNEDLVRRYFVPSPYITRRFEEAQSVYKFANDIFEGLRDSERLTDKQMLALEAAVRLEANAEAAWSEAGELEELERTEAVEISRKAWIEEASNRSKKDLISSLLEVSGADVQGGKRLKNIFKAAWYSDDPGAAVEEALDGKKVSRREAGELKKALRLAAVLEEAWYGEDAKEALQRAVDGSRISKSEADDLGDILVVRMTPALTIEEMTALKPVIEQEKKGREKANKARRNILAYVYNLEKEMRTPAKKEEGEEAEEAEDALTRLEEIKGLSKEIRALRRAAKSDDPEKAVREAFAQELILEDYDAIEKRGAALRRRSLVEVENEAQGGADVAGLLEALAMRAIDEDMPMEEFDRLKKEIIQGGGAGKNGGRPRSKK